MRCFRFASQRDPELRLDQTKHGFDVSSFVVLHEPTDQRWQYKPALWKQMFHLYSYNSKRFMESYHKRSNVETTFHMIKAKFGIALRSKTKTAQINEALCKVLCHNICVVIQSIYELGIEPAFWADDPRVHI